MTTKDTNETKVVGVGTATVEHSATGAVVHTDEQVTESVYSSPPMNVGLSLSKTVNLGNYENVKVQVSLHCPCELGEQDAVFEFVTDWCDTKLGGILDDIGGQVNG